MRMDTQACCIMGDGTTGMLHHGGWTHRQSLPIVALPIIPHSLPLVALPTYLQVFPTPSTIHSTIHSPSLHLRHRQTFVLWWTIEEWLPKLNREFDYLVMIDNDVPLPVSEGHGFDSDAPERRQSREEREYFDFKAITDPKELFCCSNLENKDTVGVAYTIRAVPKPKPGGGGTGCSWGNWLVSMQDAEYKLSGFTKLFQSDMGSAFYAHGAVSLWKLDVLKKRILLHHDTEFHGEAS